MDTQKIIYSMIKVGRIYPPNKQVLRDISLSYFYGAKIGVLGLNGAGKSSLLRIMAGVDTDYTGETMLSPGFTVGYLEQEPQLDNSKTVRQIVEEGVQDIVDTLREFDDINAQFAEEMSPDEMEALLDRAFSQTINAMLEPPARVPAKVSYATKKLRSQGPLVMYLEYQLAALKYRPGLIDGIFDIRTRDAVLAFQKLEGLKRDGIVGASFWQRLATAETPTPRIEEPGRRVEIDLTKQVLFMIEDNEVVKIVHCSSGASKTQTLTGYFEIEHKMERWTICSYRTAMYYSSFFDLDHKLAIHGYAQVPTWPASHGCVRVPMWTAKELYEEMPMGTRVYVYKS